MKKKMVCILMAGVMASLVPAQMVFAEGDSGEKTVVKFQTWNPGTMRNMRDADAREIRRGASGHSECSILYMPYTDHVEKLKG